MTGIGLTVNGLRKLGGEVADSAKHLITKWKKMVVEESSNQDDDDDDDEDDEEQEEEELKQKVHVKIERQSSEERNAQKGMRNNVHASLKICIQSEHNIQTWPSRIVNNCCCEILSSKKEINTRSFTNNLFHFFINM